MWLLEQLAIGRIVSLTRKDACRLIQDQTTNEYSPLLPRVFGESVDQLPLGVVEVDADWFLAKQCGVGVHVGSVMKKKPGRREWDRRRGDALQGGRNLQVMGSCRPHFQGVGIKDRNGYVAATMVAGAAHRGHLQRVPIVPVVVNKLFRRAAIEALLAEGWRQKARVDVLLNERNRNRPNALVKVGRYALVLCHQRDALSNRTAVCRIVAPPIFFLARDICVWMVCVLRPMNAAISPVFMPSTSSRITSFSCGPSVCFIGSLCGVQVGAQPLARNDPLSRGLYRDHSARRATLPVTNSLRGYTDCPSKGSRASSNLDCVL